MKGAHARSLYPHVLSALRECAAALAAGADGDASASCRQTTRIPYDSHPACSPHTPRILHVSRSLRTLHPPCDSHALGDSGAPCDSRDSHALGDSGTPCDSRAPHALSRPLRILDMGCGTGALAQQVLEAFPSCELSGVDLSARMLSCAAARLGSRARLACADSERLPFPDGLFDLVPSLPRPASCRIPSMARAGGGRRLRHRRLLAACACPRAHERVYEAQLRGRRAYLQRIRAARHPLPVVSPRGVAPRGLPLLPCDCGQVGACGAETAVVPIGFTTSNAARI